jgi:hypothetical protein
MGGNCVSIPPLITYANGPLVPTRIEQGVRFLDGKPPAATSWGRTPRGRGSPGRILQAANDKRRPTAVP